LLAAILVGFSGTVHGTILWEHPESVLILQNGAGEDILRGAIKPQDTNSGSTLYFRFRIDPIADSAAKSIADYEAGFVLVENGEEHLGLGNSRGAWAYCAMNVPKSKKGYVDLNSAKPEPGYRWEYMRAGSFKYIAFKVEFVPGRDARIRAWLSPYLSLDATEINQPTNIVTEFEARATFNEIHLIHRGGNGGGWVFSQMVSGTSFEDLRLRHFWQRWSFIGVASVGLLAVIIGGVQLFERRRVQRQIQQLENERAVATERTRIARDIHDELGANLTKICKLAQMMDRHGETEGRSTSFSQMISDTARDTIQTMDEIVWAVNPQNDTLKEMADYLVYFAEDFLRPSGIVCCLDVPLNLPDLPVTAEVRHHLFMVLKEALNNAVRHGHPKQIKLSLALADGRLVIEIADDGHGFVLDGAATVGNGLENMRKRSSEIGGEFQLQSQPGRGTSVRLQVALRPIKTLFHE
jgi:signal transduction histidine kinase